MTNLFPTDVIVSSDIEKYKTIIKAGDHIIIADEPLDLHGGNSGAMPTQLLAAALGSCTSITIRMYAERKNMSLESVEVSVNIDKISPTNSLFIRKIKINGNLSNEERDRLFQVANVCPVHKILTGEINIETSLVE
ncbi:MAG: OsmC family protein [Leptospira sp.]|nr:OsmC family protein [Leptospira sp.]